MRIFFVLLLPLIIALNFTTVKIASAEEPAPNAAPDPGQNQRVLQPGYLDNDTFTSLVNDAMRAEEKRGGRRIGQVDFFAEIRYHYAINGGAEKWSRNSSGFRTYLAADVQVTDKWRLISMLEMQNDIMNYNNIFKPFQRLYALGKLGSHTLSLGSFGYLMAEGNVYDSGFTGVRSVFGGPVKYTLSYGETNDTKKTAVFTARYDEDDYSLEAGIYRYAFKDYNFPQNTLFTLANNYYIDDFTLGAMGLYSSKEDEHDNKWGHVFSLSYGKLKTWQKGSYGIYLKHYDQPRGTYIAHGMNGRGNSMRGFKGYGAGVGYVVAPNILLNVERYDLKDKITGERGTTWWNSLTFFR